MEEYLSSIPKPIEYYEIFYNQTIIRFNLDGFYNEIQINSSRDKILCYHCKTSRFFQSTYLDFTKENIDYCLEKIKYCNDTLKTLVKIPGRNKFGVFEDFHLNRTKVDDLEFVRDLFNKVYLSINYFTILRKIKYLYYIDNKLCYLSNSDEIEEFSVDEIDKFINDIKNLI